MRGVFHSFLEERGVNESLFPFLQAWIYVKDHRNLLRWFKSESESEEYILDEGDDDDDLEEEHETQVHPEAETEVKKAPEVPAPPKEPERQLSKKELKQKEQAEFDALLADFGVGPNNGQENSQARKRKKENTVGESKASKKKKKKDKQKEVKESQDEVKTNSDAAAEEQEETSSSMFIKEGVGLPGLTETFEIAALVCVHYDGLLDGKCLLGVIGGTRGKNKRSACTSARSDLRSWLKNNKTGSSCLSSLCDFMHG
ncbi:hypothetical protein HID58_040483 [Brassica napus]|uniref:Uncharacterized protein n=1 Tax=Brassica napus TaxID=3708 RepID=A0ABQ8B884_BRANA|nr:hypothetical protein HID58_040483 [Brassica napus]